MATADGVRVLEYNARLGDPETMNVLPLLSGDGFLELCWGVATGRLDRTRIEFRRKASVCKYVVPAGYPDAPAKTEPLAVDAFTPRDDCRMYYAAVEERDGATFMTGSRALAFVGIADSVVAAGELAEAGIRQVRGAVRHRRDIGTAELLARRVEHLKRLRSAPAHALGTRV
jgi:phosphoribosylamine--glycine ligase